MIDYFENIDFGLLSDESIKLFNHLNVTHFLNVPKFIDRYDYEPCIGSVFVYGKGSSYSFKDEMYGEISILNGTILKIENFSIYSLEKSYLQKYSKEMLDFRIKLNNQSTNKLMNLFQNK